MEPAINIILKLMPVAIEFLQNFPAIREAATTQDRARLDELHAQLSALSNSVADELRNTPDDPT